MSTFSNLTYGFSALNLLLLDANIAAAQNTRVMLGGLGVNNVDIVRTAEEALEVLTQKPVDIVVLEWAMKPISGLELTKQIRYSTTIKNPTQPILMLTSDGSDGVRIQSLNAGVNDVAKRPLSPTTLAEHIYTLIHNPKNFIVSKDYRGPDRRTPTLNNHPDEKRIQLLPPAIARHELAGYDVANGVKLILPDFSLKARINLAAMEAGLISAKEIEQQFITEGLNDAARIDMLFKQIETSIGSRAPIERMCANSSLVQARAEAYEYLLCAKVAGYLSDFCRHYFNVHNPAHKLVLEKHIQALQVILKQNIKGEGGKKGQELASELSKLVFKFV